jgi:outer membrane lipoprotein-sorting protein
MRNFRAVSILGLALSTGLTGCYKTVRIVQQTVAPEVYRSAPVEVLEKEISDRDDAIKTLNAAVEISYSTGGGKEGKVTEYTSFRGHIFVRKPRDLRVLMQLPLVGSRALDMVSDANEFTLMHAQPHGPNVWVQGTNTVTTPSKNKLENLRPPMFFDSLMVAGVGPNELVELTENTRQVPLKSKRNQVIEEPDYDLTISRIKTGNVLQRLRVIHINRIDMLPFEQDIYDDHDRVETVTTYENYQSYGDQKFPSTVTIKRPLEEYSLKIDVTKLTLNGTFDEDQFKLEIPAGVAVQQMK